MGSSGVGWHVVVDAGSAGVVGGDDFEHSVARFGVGESVVVVFGSTALVDGVDVGGCVQHSMSVVVGSGSLVVVEGEDVGYCVGRVRVGPWYSGTGLS